jgi:hypothetical protein
MPMPVDEQAQMGALKWQSQAAPRGQDGLDCSLTQL